MAEIDSIEIRQDNKIGWTLVVRCDADPKRPESWPAIEYEFDIGDVIQFHAEVDRTLGKWLADGPADFHNATVPTEVDGWPADPDLVRDLERGK